MLVTLENAILQVADAHSRLAQLNPRLQFSASRLLSAQRESFHLSMLVLLKLIGVGRVLSELSKIKVVVVLAGLSTRLRMSSLLMQSKLANYSNSLSNS